LINPIKERVAGLLTIDKKSVGDLFSNWSRITHHEIFVSKVKIYRCKKKLSSFSCNTAMGPGHGVP
jgi:hypothetical protein